MMNFKVSYCQISSHIEMEEGAPCRGIKTPIIYRQGMIVPEFLLIMVDKYQT